MSLRIETSVDGVVGCVRTPVWDKAWEAASGG